MLKALCQTGELGLVALLAVAAAGCGKIGASRVDVSGRVTADGQPLANAAVNYITEEAAWSAVSRSDGTYSIQVPPGDYRVTVSKHEGTSGTPADPDKEPNGPMKAFEGSGDPELIAWEFSDPSETTLKVNVPEGGTDTANLQVRWK